MRKCTKIGLVVIGVGALIILAGFSGPWVRF